MKKILVFLIFIICLSFTSCINIDGNRPKGEKPTKDFTIDDYLDDNAIYEQKKECLISGVSEANVIINFQLFNKAGKEVLTKEVQTDAQTNKWEITFTAPKGSFDSYKIKLSDEYGTYTHTFVNIKFGHVVMYAGDNPISDDTSFKTSNITDDENLRFFIPRLDGSKWVDIYDDENNLSPFVKELGISLLEASVLPTALVCLQYENTSLDEWLDTKTINATKPIKNYLTSISRYKENPATLGDMGFIGDLIISKIKNVNFESIIWNHYVIEEEKLKNQDYMNNYFQMLYSLVNKWHEEFSDSSFIMLQAPSSNLKGITKLRNYQNTIMNYYSFVKLIPTFDLATSGSFELDPVKLITRIKDVLTNNRSISYFSNVIYEVDDETNVVTAIKIEILNTEKLLMEIVDGESLIKYFHIYYNDSLSISPLEITPKIEENFIIISLQKEIDEENVDLEAGFYDLSKIIIEFGEADDLRECNLFNDSGIPILPFKIKIN